MMLSGVQAFQVIYIGCIVFCSPNKCIHLHAASQHEGQNGGGQGRGLQAEVAIKMRWGRH